MRYDLCIIISSNFICSVESVYECCDEQNYKTQATRDRVRSWIHEIRRYRILTQKTEENDWSEYSNVNIISNLYNVLVYIVVCSLLYTSEENWLARCSCNDHPKDHLSVLRCTMPISCFTTRCYCTSSLYRIVWEWPALKRLAADSLPTLHTLSSTDAHFH